MPPSKSKKTTVSNKKVVKNDSSSSDSDSDDQVPIQQVDSDSSASDVQDEPEPFVKSKSKTTAAASASKSTKQQKKTKHDNVEEEPQAYVNDNSNPQYQQKQRNLKSVLNFRYEDYVNLEDPINSMSVEDILKTATAKAKEEGKTALVTTLRNTLQAMACEKSFPVFERPYQPRPTFDNGYNNSHPYRGGGNSRQNTTRQDNQY